ncbi:MAG: hypothetical protein RBS50_16740 [Phenylobacterium sp.]|jgi:hypothetical protein|uniref:hypothetical protein n=1 Tax=Phenylobacterium sp. TaxID=1871053 RepID=UPI002A369C41|nr:hypothetical protein [Phenylobacterium sp.]MDX9999602.1 hypothetical protein [Phenylobacterium sp.]
MRIVSSNSEEDIKCEHARLHVQSAARALTANLMRITRGAGRPTATIDQMVDLLKAMDEFQEIARYWPYDELAEALTLTGREELALTAPDDYVEEFYAKQSIVRGALQFAASDLVGQRTQQAAGEHEMYLGINQIGEVRERRRQEWAEARRSAAAQARAVKKAAAVAGRKVKKSKAEP